MKSAKTYKLASIQRAEQSDTAVKKTAMHLPSTQMPTPQETLAAIGLRSTPSRLAVLDVLIHTSHALTHQEVLNALDGVIEYDRVTIYRVLDWLVENNIVHKVVGQDRAWRFQLNSDETRHQHAHFKCTKCGKVFCLADVIPALTEAIPKNFKVSSVELNFKGCCADCEGIQ